MAGLLGFCAVAFLALSFVVPAVASADSPAEIEYQVAAPNAAGSQSLADDASGDNSLPAATEAELNALSIPDFDRNALSDAAATSGSGIEAESGGFPTPAALLGLAGVLALLTLAVLLVARRRGATLPAARRLVAAGAGASVIVVAAMTVALTHSPSASAKAPAVFWGVSPQIVPDQEQFERIKRGGVDSVRIPVPWDVIQPSPTGPINWEGLDETVRKAASARVEVFPFIYNSPKWVAKPANTLPIKTAKQRTAFKNFMVAIVERYGPNGEFFDLNPTVPSRPIRIWQVFNEANFFPFAQRPNPGDYGDFVKIADKAINSVDPGAKTILAGLFANPKQGPPRAFDAVDFLEQMYKQTPGVKASFDGIALHPYAADFKELTKDVDSFRAVARKAGDASVDLYLTEIGWGSQRNGGNSFEKGPAGQVRQLQGAFRVILKNQKRWRLKRVYWFSLDDIEGECNFCDSTGLFAAGFKPKASWFEYVKFAGGNPR